MGLSSYPEVILAFDTHEFLAGRGPIAFNIVYFMDRPDPQKLTNCYQTSNYVV